MKPKISLIADSAEFEATRDTLQHYSSDTSWSNVQKGAIGALRIEGASNGRYGGRHPVQDDSGRSVGYIAGSEGLGFTYSCVYSDAAGRFVISCEPMGNWPGFMQQSYLRFVGPGSKGFVEGFFTRSRGIKFEIEKTLVLPADWPSSTSAFKILNEGCTLFMLTDKGFCCVDLRQKEFDCKVEFEVRWQWHSEGFAISPKVKLLAIPFSHPVGHDPVTGEEVHSNFVRLYDMNDGRVVSEASLPDSEFHVWSAAFSSDGRRLAISSKTLRQQFLLQSEGVVPNR